MRIIILGDSLPLHRPSEGIDFSDTYGNLLRERVGPEDYVFIIGKRRNDSSIQADPERMLYDMEQFEPSVVLVQIGIVDSAPRLFSKPVHQIISNLPHRLRDLIIGFFSKRRKFFTKRFPKVYVSIADYESNMQKILDNIIKVGAVPMIINIAKPPAAVASKSHSFINNVKKYNEVLGRLAERNDCRLVDFYKMVDENPDNMCPDGIHISIEGNKKLADELLTVINDIRKSCDIE